MVNRQECILKTLLYASLFDAPLTLEEIHRYCHTPTSLTKQAIKRMLEQMGEVTYKDGFYALKNDKKYILLRQKRYRYSQQKIEEAKKLAALLQYMPTIQLIGISGSVAAYNADTTDDIDICIITSSSTVWITRLVVLLVLEILGKRRKHHEVEEKNKYCANLFFDTNTLSFKNTQDIFIAHELTALYPLFVRDDVYKKLWQRNPWIQTYLGNAQPYKEFAHKKSSLLVLVGNMILRLFEPVVYSTQYLYMRRRITTEKVTKSFLGFHPKDYRSEILCDFYHKLRLRGLLTNK